MVTAGKGKEFPPQNNAHLETAAAYRKRKAAEALAKDRALRKQRRDACKVCESMVICSGSY